MLLFWQLDEGNNLNHCHFCLSDMMLQTAAVWSNLEEELKTEKAILANQKINHS